MNDNQFDSENQDNQFIVDDQKATVEEASIKFNKLIEEIFKLLPSEKFKRKSEADCASLRPRSSIELESLKTQKPSISVPQSKNTCCSY